MNEQDMVKEVFGDALEVPSHQRAAYLDRACSGDADLRRQVEGLLAAYARAGVFLTSPTQGDAVGDVAAETPGEGIGATIGRYRLVSQIAEGGFGIVYRAEQTDPVVRAVALKIIKPGMDTRQVIARFEAERQALALMDHPHIATVLDAGATDSGRPYFVMELVDGEPITLYADRHALTIEERLRLFDQVCAAVQHAHQKGVIHRDLKPANILVATPDGRPHAKVVDFGIAKAMAHPPADGTLRTEGRQPIGTPEYMSPEQAQSSADIDTRTDVYSLGVLLYELLTGTTPFEAELRAAGSDEAPRIIREVDPPRPSTRLLTMKGAAAHVAPRRGTDPERLKRLVRGDLDWIVMKCLEKDRSRRYEAANGLAMDVRRHLEHEPVLAGPPSRTYLLRKFALRHRIGILVAAVASLTLLLGIVGTGFGLVRALTAQRAEAEQRRQAERQRDKADHIGVFMRSILAGIEPSVALGRDTTMLRELMDAAAKRINDGELRGAPEVEVVLRVAIGNAYRNIASFDEARAMLEPALALALSLYGEDHAETAAVRYHLGHLESNRGNTGPALAHAQRACETWKRLYPGDHQDVITGLQLLGQCLRATDRAGEALTVHQAALDMSRRLGPEDDLMLGRGLDYLGDTYAALGRWQDALGAREESLRLRKALPAGPELAASLGDIAQNLVWVGRPAQAVARAEEAVEMARGCLAGDHLLLAGALGIQGNALMADNRPRDAVPVLRESLAMKVRLLKGIDDPRTVESMLSLGMALCQAGHFEEALARHESALEMCRRLHPDDHDLAAKCLGNLASCLAYARRQKESLRRLRECLEMRRRLHPGDHMDVALSLHNTARGLNAVGQRQDAVPLLEEAIAMLGRLGAGGDRLMAQSQDALAIYLAALGRPDQAVPHFETALEIFRKLGTDPMLPDTLHHYADALRASGRPAEGVEPAREALSIYRARQVPNPEEYPHALLVLVQVLHAAGRADEALALVDETVAQNRQHRVRESPAFANTLATIGLLLIEQKQHARAMPIMRECLEIRSRIIRENDPVAWQRWSAMSLLAAALVGRAEDPALASDERVSLLAEAEPLLHEAYAHVDAFPSMPTRTTADRRRELEQRIVRLYIARDSAEPGRGYDAKAAEWGARSEGVEAAGNPLPPR